jgi:hypothetical protein
MSRVVPCRQTKRYTDKHSFVNAPNKDIQKKLCSFLMLMNNLLHTQLTQGNYFPLNKHPFSFELEHHKSHG